MVKILYITGINAFGGQEVFLLQLASELQNLGEEIHIAFPPNPRIIKLAQSLHLTFFTYPFANQFDFNTLYKLIKLIEVEDYDIIHTHGTRGGYLGRLAARFSNANARLIHQMYVPTHVVPAGDMGRSGPLVRLRGRIYLQVENALAKKTDQVLTVSNHLREYAISRVGIPDSKIQVLYNSTIRAADMQCPSSFIQINNASQGMPITLLFAGRLSYQKGLPYLIGSLARIKHQNHQNKITLIICGDGQMAEELQHQVMSEDLQDNVIFKGWQNNLKQYYRRCDVLIMSSLWEGLPLVILEAMSFRRAVIATNVGGIPEAVIDRKTGFLVNPKDIDGLAKAILDCIDDRQLVREMGLNGYDLCREKFTLDASVEKVIGVYNNLNAI